MMSMTRVSTMQGFGDCPYFYKLPVDGDPANEKWIVYGGHGVYPLSVIWEMSDETY